MLHGSLKSEANLKERGYYIWKSGIGNDIDAEKLAKEMRKSGFHAQAVEYSTCIRGLHEYAVWVKKTETGKKFEAGKTYSIRLVYLPYPLEFTVISRTQKTITIDEGDGEARRVTIYKDGTYMDAEKVQPWRSEGGTLSEVVITAYDEKQEAGK